MEWNKITNVNKKINYSGNITNGVKLPKLGKLVLLCYKDNYNKDCYVGAYLIEGNFGLEFVLPDGSVKEDINNTMWSYFDLPFTDNNTGYAIAFKKDGVNYMDNIPYIVEVADYNNNNINIQIKNIADNKNGTDITVFKFIKPCEWLYDWDYIKEHTIAVK